MQAWWSILARSIRNMRHTFIVRSLKATQRKQSACLMKSAIASKGRAPGSTVISSSRGERTSYTSSIKSRCLNLLKINLSYRFSMQFTSYDILIYNYSPFITYCSILYYSLTLFIFIWSLKGCNTTKQYNCYT